jgi:hypothetical protein
MGLLFDTLARAEDPEICVVWLDVLNSWEAFPPSKLRLAVFNPTREAREVRLSFPLGAHQSEAFRLDAGEARRLDLPSE